MRGQAAARMTVPFRKEPLPVEEVERRLDAGQPRDQVLHNAGYTEKTFDDAVFRRAFQKNHDDWWAEMQVTMSERQRKSLWRKLARGKRSKIRLDGEHPLERENARKARMRAGARAIQLDWYWREKQPKG